MRDGLSSADLRSTLAITFEVARDSGEKRRHDRQRGLLAARVDRSSVPARLAAAILRVVRHGRHSLTTRPCCVPDGTISRTAGVLREGEWALVCQVA